jgi:hypothetical protein
MALEPADTAGTVADRHLEAGGVDLRVGHIHLPLLLVAVKADLAPAVRAALRQRGHHVAVGRAGRNRPVPVAAVSLASLEACTARPSLRVSLGERGARALMAATGVLQRLLQLADTVLLQDQRPISAGDLPRSPLSHHRILQARHDALQLSATLAYNLSPDPRAITQPIARLRPQPPKWRDAPSQPVPSPVPDPANKYSATSPPEAAPPTPTPDLPSSSSERATAQEPTSPAPRRHALPPALELRPTGCCPPQRVPLPATR